MHFLRQWVLHNWGLKLLALLISFLLWSTYTTQPPAEAAYLVPLEFRNIPPNLEISGDVPTQVRVRLRGRSALLRRIMPADIGVHVDLAGKPAGEMLVGFTSRQVDVPFGAEVVGITPSAIRLRLVLRSVAR